MQRLTNALKTLQIAAFAPNYANYQSLRWRRKPRWLPKARSKVFKVAPRPVAPEEEKTELKRLFNNYRTQIKSLRRHLDRSHNMRFAQSVDLEAHLKEFESDFVECQKVNDKWNEACKLLRDERIKDVMRKDAELAQQRLVDRKNVEKVRLELAEGVVLREKQAAKGFITPETLDAAIETAIVNPVDHNFALDLDGSKIEGREAKPIALPQEVSAKQ